MQDAVPDHSLFYRSADTGPGLHVLLVGISQYQFLAEGEKELIKSYGLGQLDCAARTAGELARWLLNPTADLSWPLRTLRLLASPSKIERGLLPEFDASPDATLENLQVALHAWRQDASAHPDGATLFYFAGHGIQRTRGDSVLLLSDFLDPHGPMLARAIDFNEIYDGMAEPNYDQMAHTQVYFVDACRSDFPKLQTLANATPASVWDITEGGRDDRVAPIFLGASVGRPAFGSRTPGEVSAFGRDVMTCLAGAGADLLRHGPDARWTVTIGTLQQALAQLVKEANKSPGRDLRSFSFDRWTNLDTALVTLRTAPEVRCRFTFDPTDAQAYTTITLDGLRNAKPCVFPAQPLDPGGYRAPAGGYVLSAEFAPSGGMKPATLARQIVSLRPPYFDFPIVFT
jgi:hypothetical protein